MTMAPAMRLIALLAAMAGPVVAAQTLDPRNEAAALYNVQQSALAALPTVTPSAQIVPGYGGEVPGLQSYAANGASLASAGQAAIVGNDLFATTSAASQAAGSVGVSSNDAWLQRSLSVVNAPAAYSGGAQGSGGSSCETASGTETIATETLYTCESGTRVTEEAPSCTRVFRPDLSGGTGQVGWAHYTCQEGWRDDPGGRTCDVPLVVTASTQHKYECELLTYCQNGHNQEMVRCSQFPNAACTRTGYFYKQVGRGGCHLVFQYSCPAPVSGPQNNETVIRHMGTAPGTASAAWNEAACNALASDATCTLTSETCIEGAGTRTINGVAVYQACWKKRRTYSCSSLTHGAGCNPPAGSQFLSQTCLWADAAGVCRLFQKTYRSISSISGAGGSWSYEPACPAAGDGACTETSSNCIEGPGTRVVDGVSVTTDCWRQAASFQCTRPDGQGSDCDVRPGCVWKQDRCIDEDAPAGACRTTEHVYSCAGTETHQSSGTLCGAQICMGDQCYTLRDQTSSDLPEVFASMAAMQTAGEDHNAGVSLFKGEALRCKKAVLGFRNCCKDSGWGLDIGIAGCDAQETELAQRQQAKACHYVGTWCSKDTFFGCAEKSMRYCCFEGVLGRIVQEAGRVQVGKGWGAAKSPDCSGFTVEQFQQLDLSRVDFSEFTRQAMKNMTAPGEGGTVGAIQQSLERLYQSGQPGSGG